MSTRSEFSSKVQDSGRIGTRLADQIRHQKEVIQSLVREKTHLAERNSKLEQEFKLMEDKNLRLVRCFVDGMGALSSFSLWFVTTQINEVEEQCQLNELAQRQISDMQLESKKLQSIVDVLKKHREEEEGKMVDEEKRFKLRMQEAGTESERIAKDNISLRMYCSRLETEIEISRKAVEEMSASRQRDARTIDIQKQRVENLTAKCRDLEEARDELNLKLLHTDREKSKTIAAMELTLQEKNRNLAVLENSLKIAIEEVASSEKGLLQESQQLSSQLTCKNEEINKLLVKMKEMERELQTEMLVFTWSPRMTLYNFAFL
jgi:myosin heavy subunit